jgi:hypothetical protein
VKTLVQALRERYGLKPHTVAPNNPTREEEWNELARLFVQRFQQIHDLPTDSLAGPHAFRVLDGTAVGDAVIRTHAKEEAE